MRRSKLLTKVSPKRVQIQLKDMDTKKTKTFWLLNLNNRTMEEAIQFLKEISEEYFVKY